MLPPGRDSASSTWTSAPRRMSWCAVASPAMPPPTTATRTGVARALVIRASDRSREDRRLAVFFQILVEDHAQVADEYASERQDLDGFGGRTHETFAFGLAQALQLGLEHRGEVDT